MPVSGDEAEHYNLSLLHSRADSGEVRLQQAAAVRGPVLHQVRYPVRAVLAAFNQEKALVGPSL